MQSYHYRYAGLRVASALLIPEWARFAQSAPEQPAEVSIRLAPAQEQARTQGGDTPVSEATAEMFHLFIPETGDFWVRHGREIVVRPVPAAGAREVRLFLLGSAWGALCYQRGLLALHASVVRTGRGAVAFCGPAGSGKSSMAAWLVKRGYPLISDDLCHFETGDGQAMVHPSAPRLKLWHEALQAMGWQAEGLERDHFRTEKFHREVPSIHPEADRPVPVTAIHILGWGAPSLARLTGLDALHQLVAAATYRGDLLEPMGQTAAHWQRCRNLAQSVPVFRLTRPQDWSAMNGAMDRFFFDTAPPPWP